MLLDEKTEQVINEISNLLIEAKLIPVQLASNNLYFFCDKDSEGKIVGVIGLELYGKGSLLRSLVVKTGKRNQGIARSLIKEALNFAESIASYDVYLITETIGDTMERYGFRTVAREQVPEAILKSPYLTGICPSSSRIMYKKLA